MDVTNHASLAVWERWNSDGGPRYPNEKVVQFCFRNYPGGCRLRTHALDLGCGSGVHAVFLAREGFRVTAVDFSETGVANTREKLAAQNLTAEVRCSSLFALDFPERTFDLVLCIGVIETMPPDSSARALSRLRPLLRAGARGLFLFAAADDFRVATVGTDGLHGYTRPEVEEIFLPHFERLWIDEYMTTYEGGRVVQRDWLVTVFASEEGLP